MEEYELGILNSYFDRNNVSPEDRANLIKLAESNEQFKKDLLNTAFAKNTNPKKDDNTRHQEAPQTSISKSKTGQNNLLHVSTNDCAENKKNVSKKSTSTKPAKDHTYIVGVIALFVVACIFGIIGWMNYVPEELRPRNITVYQVNDSNNIDTKKILSNDQFFKGQNINTDKVVFNNTGKELVCVTVMYYTNLNDSNDIENDKIESIMPGSFYQVKKEPILFKPITKHSAEFIEGNERGDKFKKYFINFADNKDNWYDNSTDSWY